MKNQNQYLMTLYLPDRYIEAIKILVDLKRFDSKSAVIRQAITNFLENDGELDVKLQNFRDILIEQARGCL